MKTALITVTLVEVALLVVVLAVYLLVIAGTLRSIARTLGLVTFGVRAIERQTEPLGTLLGDVNGALQGVAGALEGAVGPLETRQPTERIQSPETGGASA